MSITGMENAFHKVQDLVVNQVTLKRRNKKRGLDSRELKEIKLTVSMQNCCQEKKSRELSNYIFERLPKNCLWTRIPFLLGT